jgi:hypothetical protein
VGDVAKDEETGIYLVSITEDEARGTRLKTASSRRVVPVHPELVKLGFLEVVSECPTTAEKAAPLFPLLTHRWRSMSRGAKEMDGRCGLRALSEAFGKVTYRGLDLSNLHSAQGLPCRR